ncbi:MAG: hypothetical protein FJ265_08275 [Planctomycetes bacterium]|nr:hypothetical protein [Planctomycetota bacterium]
MAATSTRNSPKTGGTTAPQNARSMPGQNECAASHAAASAAMPTPRRQSALRRSMRATSTTPFTGTACTACDSTRPTARILAAACAVADRPDRREHLIRGIARPPFAEERLAVLPGCIAYALKKRWRDGTSCVVLDPLTFLERLAALVPRPHKKTVTWHGVFAPAAGYHERVVPERSGSGAAPCRHRPATGAEEPQPPPESTANSPPPEPAFPQCRPRAPHVPRRKPPRRRRYYLWHELLRRAFGSNALAAPPAADRDGCRPSSPIRHPCRRSSRTSACRPSRRRSPAQGLRQASARRGSRAQRRMGRCPAGAKQYELLASWNAPVPCPANRANLPIAAARIPARGTGSNAPLGRAWSLRGRNRSLFHPSSAARSCFVRVRSIVRSMNRMPSAWHDAILQISAAQRIP